MLKKLGSVRIFFIIIFFITELMLDDIYTCSTFLYFKSDISLVFVKIMIPYKLDN